MHIDAGVKVGMTLIAAGGAEEELAPFAWHALASLVREPHAPTATPRAIQTGAMRIDFNTDHALCIRFLSGELVDFPSQLIRLFAIASSGFAPSSGFDRTQALKEQHTAGIALTDLNDGACGGVGGVQVLSPDVRPQLSVAPLPLDRFAGLPLLLGNPFEMAIAVLIEPVIGDKARPDDLPVLPDGDHRQLFDVQIDRHRDQIGIALALHHLPGGDGFGLQEVDGG